MRTLDSVFIDGVWRKAQGTRRVLLAPATEVPFASVCDGTACDVDDAVSAAQRAAESWAVMDAVERGQRVAAMGELLGECTDELIGDFATEIGTPIADARRLQVQTALHAFSQAPVLASHFASVAHLGAAQVRRVPIGVAACITPWNYPLYQIATKIVPALVAGATVVLKPSELAPLSVHVLSRCAERAGLPAGVLNIVLGGAEVGRRLVEHPGVDVVSFTGSTATGRQVGAAAAATLKKVTLELGGKSPAVVLPDADLASAVRQTIAKCYQNAGQTCAALTRLLVSRKDLDACCALSAAMASEYRTGDPLDPATRLGPVISAQQRDRIVGMIQQALREGASLIAGGPLRPPGCPIGYYIQPTVLVVENSEAAIVQKEVFGPVLVIQPYDDVDQAVRRANGTPFGLSAAVWSADPDSAASVAKRLRAGSVSLNGAATHPDAPFGGFGASGYGRERGVYGLDTYSTTQTLNL